jgi:hypothetical protein
VSECVCTTPMKIYRCAQEARSEKGRIYKLNGARGTRENFYVKMKFVGLWFCDTPAQHMRVLVHMCTHLAKLPAAALESSETHADARAPKHAHSISPFECSHSLCCWKFIYRSPRAQINSQSWFACANLVSRRPTQLYFVWVVRWIGIYKFTYMRNGWAMNLCCVH